jgi:PAS domain S-box-containing protein
MRTSNADWATDTKVNILLVDDNRRNLDVLESILQSPEYRLVRAATADEALLALIKDEFAAIVLDVQMPEINGLELAKLIKQRKRNQHIPILFLTAYLQEEKDILEGYGAGAVDYLTKPFNPLILKSKIGVFVELFLSARALARANSALELQITHRKEAQEALRQLNSELEARVQRRTEELRRSNIALAKSEEQFRRAIEEAPIPVIMQAEDGQVLQISKTWAHLTGYALDEVPTFDAWLTRAYGFGANEVRNAVRSLFERDSGMVEVEFEIVTRSGQRRIWAFSASSPGNLHDGRRFVVGTAIDITERKAAEESLRQSEERYRHLVHALPAAIYTCDAQGFIQLYNEAAVELWGRRPEVGKDQWCGSLRIFEPDGRTPMRLDECPMAAAIRFGETINGREIIIERPDGGRSSVMVYPHPTRDASGNITGAVNMLVDITARKQAEESLREAKAETEAASKAKDDFLAALSHELRTPLTPAILLASEWERDASLPEDARRAFSSIRQDIELEARLIDDLLDLTRIAKGKTRLVPEAVEVHELLRTSWELLQAEAVERQVKVRFELNAPHSWVQADPVRLQQVFWNVIRNAVRFSPKHEEITIRSQSGPNDRLFVQIMDKGPGIEAADLERIFLPFDQGRRKQQTGGLGLGLAISRRLMELHGGRITASSDGAGRGATFSIELITTAARPRPTRRPNAQENQQQTSARRILLVEDHDQTRQTLARLLTSRGHEVAAAETARQARDLARTFAYDLVLTDLGLPDGNGHELMMELQQLRPACKGIALSGYGMEGDVQRSRAAGFDMHLTKPVDIGALENALRQASQDRSENPVHR